MPRCAAEHRRADEDSRCGHARTFRPKERQQACARRTLGLGGLLILAEQQISDHTLQHAVSPCTQYPRAARRVAHRGAGIAPRPAGCKASLPSRIRRQVRVEEEATRVYSTVARAVWHRQSRVRSASAEKYWRVGQRSAAQRIEMVPVE